ncbi:MAG: sodium:proton antiporter [Thiotrichales bacterium]|nr:MAG: sodium:proton antiporter [Thiotrichales bacterium]
MYSYSIICVLLVIAVSVYYLNVRFIKLQTTVALTLMALLISLTFVFLQKFGVVNWYSYIQPILLKINFTDLLLNGMLGFLLFAGGLGINLKTLLKYKWEVGTLALVGTIASSILIALGLYVVLQLFSYKIDFIYCWLFGAIVSPTDPIAVLATVKQCNAPHDLGTKIAGESLFNDGIGLVIFITIYKAIFLHQDSSWQNISLLFLREAIGGMLYGLVLGTCVYKLLKAVDDFKLSVLVTLCVASAGYLLAQHLDISGPLAMVIAGLIVGNYLHQLPKSSHHHSQLHDFWELLDEILNTVLFFLIGLELMILKVYTWYIWAALCMIPIVLLVRLITVAVPMVAFKTRKKYAPFVITILTWGGLRGGLALAMALSLPDNPHRDILLMITYCIVVFSIVFQGTTSKPLIKLSQDKGSDKK